MRRGTGIGLVLFICGVIYLLVQAGVLHISTTLWSGNVIWPLLLVVVSWGGLREFRRGKIPWASLYFVVLGLILAAKGSGVVPWFNRFDGWNLTWALLLIFVGLYLITPRRWRGFGEVLVIRINRGSKALRHKDEQEAFEENERKPPRFKQSFKTESGKRLLGDVSIGQHPWVLKDMELWNGIGDIRVNLATAHVEDGDYHLDIGGWIGDVRILLPEDLDVAIEADVRLGEIVVFGESQSGTGRRMYLEDAGYGTSNRRCRIKVALQIGDIQVTRV